MHHRRAPTWAEAVEPGTLLAELPGVAPRPPAEPRHARLTDPDTSHEAAPAPTKRRPSWRDRNRAEVRHRLTVKILDAHERHPDDGLTDEELSALLPGRHPGTISKRRLDLVRSGLISASDERRPTTWHASATVWRRTSTPRPPAYADRHADDHGATTFGPDNSVGAAPCDRSAPWPRPMEGPDVPNPTRLCAGCPFSAAEQAGDR